MVTREKEATAKADISTLSSESKAEPKLRPSAPQLRTAEQILAKNDQILDGLDRGVLTPKMAEQMGQCIKTPVSLARLELSVLRMISLFGRKAPVPRSPLLRSAIGLKESVAASDGEFVRALIAEK